MDFLSRVGASKGIVRDMRRLPVEYVPLRSSCMSYAGTWTGELNLVDILGVVGVHCDRDCVTLYLAITSSIPSSINSSITSAVYRVKVPASLVTRLVILAVVDAAMCNDVDPRGMWNGAVHFFDKIPRLQRLGHMPPSTPPNSPSARSVTSVTSVKSVKSSSSRAPYIVFG